MNCLKYATMVIMILGLTGYASAELKKIRDFPTTMSGVSPEVKKQFEYDPEAGGASSKVITVTTQYIKNGAKISGDTTNYEKGIAVSGTGKWNEVLSVYHGFGALLSMSGFRATKLKYSSSGKWPAQEFKIYTVHQQPQGEYKAAIACKQSRVTGASSHFPTLPGNIYMYECITQNGSVSPTFTYAPDPLSLVSLYSDYLDMPVSTFYIDGRTANNIQSNFEVTFTGSDGGTHTIRANESEVRQKFGY